MQTDIKQGAKLDKGRSFGLIYGEPSMAFEQDGVHFSADGKAVQQWSSLEQIAQERAKANLRRQREEEIARARYARQRREEE